ncbi:protein of unknown function [Pararobbsia alpina]
MRRVRRFYDRLPEENLKEVVERASYPAGQPCGEPERCILYSEDDRRMTARIRVDPDGT